METNDRYVIGMDCGTTNIKAIVLNQYGKKIAEASRKSRSIKSFDGGSEQDANEWWNNASSIIKELTSTIGEQAKQIEGICISCHTVSMLAVDEEGRPLRNAVTYQDSRSAKELEHILDTVGYDKFCRIVATIPAPSFLPSKILWFKNTEEALFNKTKYFLQANGYINYKLTGRFSIDMDQATRTQCLDMGSLTWSEEIGNAVGVDFTSVFPKIFGVDQIVGYVTEEACKITGLREGTPVLAGASDATAAMLATGISGLGQAGESSGTSSLVFAASQKQGSLDCPVASRPSPVDAYPWIFDGPISTSGASLKWYMDLMAKKDIIEAQNKNIDIFTYLNDLALEAKAGSGGLIFYPYLLGERAPIWNDYARSMFIGLSMNTTRSQLIRSVFEGSAYALRHVLETIGDQGIKIDSLRVCGGGSKSRAWNKIKASVLGLPIYVLDEKSGDVPLGTALLAGHKLGLFPDLSKSMDEIIKVKEIIYPDMEEKVVYDKLYRIYLRVYKNIDRDLKELKAVRDKDL